MAPTSLPIRYPELLFNGKPMNPEPRNMSLSLAAAVLDHGDTVLVRLEPGDMTRYEWLIIPQWTPGLRTQADFLDAPRDWLYILNAGDGQYVRGAVFSRGESYQFLVESMGYATVHWTSTLAEWWFDQCLWPRIDAIRGVPSESRGDPRSEGGYLLRSIKTTEAADGPTGT